MRSCNAYNKVTQLTAYIIHQVAYVVKRGSEIMILTREDLETIADNVIADFKKVEWQGFLVLL